MELFFFILINNVVALSIAFVLSPILCIVPVASLLGNGWLIALAFSAALEQESLGYVLAGILPHGVIEIPALLLALAAAIRFGSSLIVAVFKREKRAQVIPVLVESARYLGIALLLLPAAALVETFITPLLLGLM
jgi:stage II sporulation protein M